MSTQATTTHAGDMAEALYEQRAQFLLAPNATVRGGLIFCILAGILTFVAGMYMGEATRTWGSYLFNLFFFFLIGLGGIVFAGMQDVISAKWGRPIMRLHESFASFLPVALICFGIFYLCIAFHIGRAQDVYVWIKNPSIVANYWGKRTWLQPTLMISRDFGAVLAIVLLSFWQLRLKLKPDTVYMAGNQAEGLKLGRESKAKLRYWTAPVLVLYALLLTMLAFDVTMSLAPTWYSSLWGGWTFAVMMQSLMASLLIFMYVVKSSAVGHYVQRQQFHDVGKMMHGFTIFFAYLTYAHIITIWYGNMPEETQYFIKRLHGPWLGLVLAVLFLVFIVPLFSLLPKVSKWTSGLAIPICLSILFAQWIAALLQVIPETADATTWTLPWIEVGAFLGFLGLFVGSIFRFGRRFPMLAVADPLLHETFAEGSH